MEEVNQDAAAPAPAAPPRPLFKLKLHHDGVYWGVEEILAGDIYEGDVVLDHVPDNAPGRFKWNAAEKRFDALAPSQIKTAPEAPSLEQALHDVIASLEAAGHAIPPAAAAWRAAFKNTLEGYLK